VTTFTVITTVDFVAWRLVLGRHQIQTCGSLRSSNRE